MTALRTINKLIIIDQARMQIQFARVHWQNPHRKRTHVPALLANNTIMRRRRREREENSQAKWLNLTTHSICSFHLSPRVTEIAPTLSPLTQNGDERERGAGRSK
jgi:hypothetical protein